jgi:hypothetical protein
MFQKIKKEYDDFYASLLSQGKLPLRSTEKGFWGHVPAQEVYEAFKHLGLQKHRTFVDLGSGDGKVVLIASLFCHRAVGIEIDNELFRKSLEIQKNIGISNAVFFNNDFYEHGISGFDAVFIYPDEPMHRNLEKKFQNELTGKLIHCGHHFHPKTLNRQHSFSVNDMLVTVYTR